MNRYLMAMAVIVLGITQLGPAPVSASQNPELSVHQTDDGSVIYSGDQASIEVRQSASAVVAESAAQPLSAARIAITCTLAVHNVHGSTHVKGTINGTADVKCKFTSKTEKPKMSALGISYSLIRVSPRNNQWAAPMRNNSGRWSIQNNRGVSCKEGAGRFQGWAQGVMDPPKGYKLVGNPTYSKYGPTKWVGCGDKSQPQIASGTISEEITVTFEPIG